MWGSQTPCRWFMSELVCRPYIELMADKLSPLSYGLEMGRCSNAASLKQSVRNFGNLLFQNPSLKLGSQNFGFSLSVSRFYCKWPERQRRLIMSVRSSLV